MEFFLREPHNHYNSAWLNKIAIQYQQQVSQSVLQVIDLKYIKDCLIPKETSTNFLIARLFNTVKFFNYPTISLLAKLNKLVAQSVFLTFLLMSN